jgi:hypothetical protein
VLFSDILGDELDDFEIDVEFFEIYRRNAILLGQKVGELGFLDRARFYQRGANSGPVPLLIFLCLSELLDGDQVLANQQFTKTTRHAMSPDLRTELRG